MRFEDRASEKRAFLGVGFRERQSAFDLRATLQVKFQEANPEQAAFLCADNFNVARIQSILRRGDRTLTVTFEGGARLSAGRPRPRKRPPRHLRAEKQASTGGKRVGRRRAARKLERLSR